MAGATQFIGSKISLISKAEVRYEGFLYMLDVKEATISLAKVRAFGTENRPTDRPMAPRDDIYDFIVFRGAYIKNIDVLEPPKPQTSEDRITTDPAITEVSLNSSRNQQGNAFPRFNGPGQNARQQTYKNLIEGFLRYPCRANSGDEGSGQGAEVSCIQEPGRGRGGGARPFIDFRSARPYFNFSPRGRGGGGKGMGHRRPQGMFPQPATAKVKFENDFDELLPKIKAEPMPKPSHSTDVDAEGAMTDDDTAAGSLADKENKYVTTYYNKNNFFNAISCEALERAKGPLVPLDRRNEVKVGSERSGLSGQRRGYYRGGPGGIYYGHHNGCNDRSWSCNPSCSAGVNWYGRGQKAY